MNAGAAGGAAGHWLVWKGGSAGAGGGGVCGRPTSDVDHVPTQRSLLPLCAEIAEWIASRARAAKTSCRFRDLMGCAPFGCCRSKNHTRMLIGVKIAVARG